MKQEKAVATKQNTELAIVNQGLDVWNEDDTFFSKEDIRIPQILIMQGLSEAVTDGKAMFGELRDSISNELLGGIGKPIEFVPFRFKMYYEEHELDEKSGKYKYKRKLPVNTVADNQTARTREMDGVKRFARLEFYVLLVEHIKQGIALPKLLAFKSTSYRTGTELLTQMKITNAKAKLGYAGYVMELEVKKEQNDSGTFGVPKLSSKRLATQEEVNEALNWFKLTKDESAYVVDDEATTNTVHEPAAPSTAGVGEGMGKF